MIISIDLSGIGSLIEYSGIGVAIFTLILTNPELWQGKRQALPRWFIIVPFPFFVGLILLLLSYVMENSKITISLGWLWVIIGTILLFVTYLLFFLVNIVPRSIIKRLLFGVGDKMQKLGLSISKYARRINP